MIIKTHSGAFVNTDNVSKYEVVPIFANRKKGEFTGTSRREVDHFEVVAYSYWGNVTLGMYSDRVSAEEALDEAIDRLVNVGDIHVMSKMGMVDNMQSA